jgi:hypothetical protein
MPLALARGWQFRRRFGGRFHRHFTHDDPPWLAGVCRITRRRTRASRSMTDFGLASAVPFDRDQPGSKLRVLIEVMDSGGCSGDMIYAAGSMPAMSRRAGAVPSRKEAALSRGRDGSHGVTWYRRRRNDSIWGRTAPGGAHETMENLGAGR